MRFTRRQFIRGGVSAFTVGFAAPEFITDLALAQAAPGRSLVVLYLGGGNDALSTLIPYRDTAYYSRRPTLAVPAGNVLQIGTDSSGVALGLHPRLTDMTSIFDQGRLAIIQRTGYQNSSRSHFQGFDIWGTANPSSPEGTGWLGRYLDTLPTPIDPLVGWNTTRETPRKTGSHPPRSNRSRGVTVERPRAGKTGPFRPGWRGLRGAIQKNPQPKFAPLHVTRHNTSAPVERWPRTFDAPLS